MWRSIFFKTPFIFKKGDVITKRIPINKYSIVYTIDDVAKDGILTLIPNTTFVAQYQCKARTISTIKAKHLLIDGWYFLVPEYPDM